MSLSVYKRIQFGSFCDKIISMACGLTCGFWVRDLLEVTNRILYTLISTVYLQITPI